MSEIVYKELSYKIIGICMEVYNNLGSGFSEIVYKDALNYEFQMNRIPFDREKMYQVHYKQIVLPHKFYADFVVDDKIILEIKGASNISNDFINHAINYLKVSRNKLALIVNFGESQPNYKRIVL